MSFDEQLKAAVRASAAPVPEDFLWNTEQMISMYEGELKATGLFKTISVSRSGTAIFYYLAYIGPGAENISPAGTVAEGEYHVQLGCANMNYASSTLTGQTS